MIMATFGVAVDPKFEGGNKACSHRRCRRRRTLQIQQRVPSTFHLLAPRNPRIYILKRLAIIINIFLCPVTFTILNPHRSCNYPEIIFRIFVQIDGFQNRRVCADCDEQRNHLEVTHTIREAGLEMEFYL